MKCPTTLIVAAFFCRTAVTSAEPVTCDSPCDGHDAYGEARWSVKTDDSLPPTDATVIRAVTPSEPLLYEQFRADIRNEVDDGLPDTGSRDSGL
jgi:hypothetical protein